MNNKIINAVISILVNTEHKFSFKTKYVFIRLIQEYGLDKEIVGSMREISGKLNISPADYKSAHIELIKSGTAREPISELDESGRGRGKGAPRKKLVLQVTG